MAKKMNMKGIAGNVIVAGITSVVAQVAAKAIEGDVDASTGKPKNETLVSAALIIGGAAVPELMKGDMTKTAGIAAMAIGAYRLSSSMDVAGKLGINGLGASRDFAAVGNYGSWQPKRTVKATKVSGTSSGKGNVQ